MVFCCSYVYADSGTYSTSLIITSGGGGGGGGGGILTGWVSATNCYNISIENNACYYLENSTCVKGCQTGYECSDLKCVLPCEGTKVGDYCVPQYYVNFSNNFFKGNLFILPIILIILFLVWIFRKIFSDKIMII